MRVGVGDLAARQQVPGVRQGRGDRIAGPVDVHAGEQRHPGVERAVIAHRLRHIQSVVAAEDKILLAMAGGDVDKTGAGFGGDEIAQQQRRVLVIAVAAQRVGHDGAGDFGALERGQDACGR